MLESARPAAAAASPLGGPARKRTKGERKPGPADAPDRRRRGRRRGSGRAPGAPGRPAGQGRPSTAASSSTPASPGSTPPSSWATPARPSWAATSSSTCWPRARPSASTTGATPRPFPDTLARLRRLGLRSVLVLPFRFAEARGPAPARRPRRGAPTRMGLRGRVPPRAGAAWPAWPAWPSTRPCASAPLGDAARRPSWHPGRSRRHPWRPPPCARTDTRRPGGRDPRGRAGGGAPRCGARRAKPCAKPRGGPRPAVQPGGRRCGPARGRALAGRLGPAGGVAARAQRESGRGDPRAEARHGGRAGDRGGGGRHGGGREVRIRELEAELRRVGQERDRARREADEARPAAARADAGVTPSEPPLRSSPPEPPRRPPTPAAPLAPGSPGLMAVTRRKRLCGRARFRRALAGPALRLLFPVKPAWPFPPVGPRAVALSQLPSLLRVRVRPHEVQ